MKYFTYIIQCSNGHYYVGHTANLAKRLERHRNKTGAQYTKQNNPISIVWSASYETELAAIKREKQIKGWGRAKKENLIRGFWE